MPQESPRWPDSELARILSETSCPGDGWACNDQRPGRKKMAAPASGEGRHRKTHLGPNQVGARKGLGGSKRLAHQATLAVVTYETVLAISKGYYSSWAVLAAAPPID